MKSPRLSLLERAKNSRRPILKETSKMRFQPSTASSGSTMERGGATSSTQEVDSCDYALHSDDGDRGQSSADDATTLEDEEAHMKQRYSPLSTTFAAVQTAVLGLMLWQCGVAPMNVNPMIGPYPDALNYWGAKNAVLIIEDGEVYRLLTPVLLHAGLLHLVGNVMVQLDAGNRWEREWGSAVWAIVYVGSTIGSSVLSVCLMPDQISVGSSGAVMGLFGAKIAEILLLSCETNKTAVQRAGARSRKEQACGVMLGVTAVMAMSFIPYVDWSAHLGGLVAGFAVGLVCFSFAIRSWFFMLVWLIAGVGACVALFSGAVAYMYTVEAPEDLRDVCGYYQQFFDDYECRCMLDEAIQWGSWGGGNGGED